MIVLKAIGRFFARIGRWIRDTAWVQPLLIVGGIFAIIFSISPIVQWVESWSNKGNESENYYTKYRLSLEDCDKQESEADGLFQYLEDIENKTETAKQKSTYGEKFFISFVQVGCAGCESNYEGFKTLQSGWNKDFEINDSHGFKLHTIYIDQDDKDINSDNIFNQYILDTYSNIFEQAITVATESDYCTNLTTSGNTEDSTYYKTASALLDEGGFVSPTSFLVDLSARDLVNSAYGITQVFFEYEGANGGTDSYAKAQTLADCWNTEGIFSDEYKK